MADEKNTKNRQIVGAVFMVNPSTIDRFDDQPRTHFDEDALLLLGQSMKEDGQREPCTITPNYNSNSPGKSEKYYLVDGERRWRAATLMGLKLKVIVSSVQDRKSHYFQSAIANTHRESFSVVEEAEVVRRFREEYELSWKQIAVHLGKDLVTLRKRYDLSHLHPDLLALLGPPRPQDQRLSIGIGSELSFLPCDEQLEIAKLVKGQPYAVAREIIRQYVKVVEEQGVVVRKNKAGRKRRPSDDAGMFQVRMKRILADIQFIRNLRNDSLTQFLSRQPLEDNAVMMSRLGQIAVGFQELRNKIEGAMPLDLRRRLPKPIGQDPAKPPSSTRGNGKKLTKDGIPV